MIDLAILGTGAMMPTVDRWLSSVLIRLGSEHLLFDAGEGVQIPWREQGWGIKPLSLICLSHHHADHVAGIPGVLLALANADRTEPVTIIGPKGTRDLISGLRAACPVLPYDLRVADLYPGASWKWQDLQISVVLGDHRVPVLLYRFDLPRRPAFLVEKAEAAGIPRESWRLLSHGIDITVDGTHISADQFLGPARRGISFGIATDTRPNENALRHFRDVDLLITEATYGDDADEANAIQNKHMTFREAAQLAAEVAARRHLVTHFSPKMGNPEIFLANGVSAFPGFAVARAGQEIALSYPDESTELREPALDLR
jgi:ribonuclease Z